MPLVVRILAVALLAAAVPTTSADAQSGRLWRAEERVLVTQFDRLGAVATDGRRVFAASPNGLEVLDAAMGRWETPSTVEDGYPAGEVPAVLAWDELSGELWLASFSGRLFAFRPHFGEWDDRGFVPGGGPVIQIRFSRSSLADPVYVRVPEGWLGVDRGGFGVEPLPANGVPPADPRTDGGLPDDPYFRSLGAALTTDAQLRQWPITGVAPGDGRDDWWISTDGGNLFHYTGFAGGTEQHVFGLTTDGAGAVLAADGVVWFGGDGRGGRSGVTRADDDLQDWRRWEGRYHEAPSARVHDLAAGHGGLWAAAADGLFRLEGAEGRWRRLSERDGLPPGEATAVAAVPGGAWVGTRGGLSFVPAGATRPALVLLRGGGIRGLALRADTLWVAADAGLWVVPLDEDGAARPPGPEAGGALQAPGSGARPALRARVLDVAATPTGVYAVASDGVHRLGTGGWEGPLREADGGVGRVRRVVGDAEAVWFAGDRGVARLASDTGLWTFHLAGGDLPAGPVWDVAPAGDHVWIAGPYGALRLEWRR